MGDPLALAGCQRGECHADGDDEHCDRGNAGGVAPGREDASYHGRLLPLGRRVSIGAGTGRGVARLVIWTRIMSVAQFGFDGTQRCGTGVDVGRDVHGLASRCVARVAPCPDYRPCRVRCTWAERMMPRPCSSIGHTRLGPGRPLRASPCLWWSAHPAHPIGDSSRSAWVRTLPRVSCHRTSAHLTSSSLRAGRTAHQTRIERVRDAHPANRRLLRLTDRQTQTKIIHPVAIPGRSVTAAPVTQRAQRPGHAQASSLERGRGCLGRSRTLSGTGARVHRVLPDLSRRARGCLAVPPVLIFFFTHKCTTSAPPVTRPRPLV